MTRQEIEKLAIRKYPKRYKNNAFRRTAFIEGFEAALSTTEGQAEKPEIKGVGQGLQERTDKWLLACFGEEIARDKAERNHRFLEEALELVQSLGCTKSEAHQLVDYTFDRPKGEPYQECGGVMITLAALCLANGLNMDECGEKELARIWTKVEKIRAKQASKPKHSPLPAPPVGQAAPDIEVYLKQRIKELNEADAAFCEKRWDMGRPSYERGIYREQSNNVTFARQELDMVLKKLSKLTAAQPAPKTDENYEPS